MIDKRGTDREERVRPIVEDQLIEYAAGVCGSCYWRRQRVVLGNITQVCTVMPKQVMAVTRGAGVQILSLNPVIEKLDEELCAMWKPLTEDTQ